MNDARKQIIFYGTKPNRSIQRVVHKQLDKWLEQQNPHSQCGDPFSFLVTLEKVEGALVATCHIRAQAGSRIWESQESGKTIQYALIEAIRRLRSSDLEAPLPSWKPQADVGRFFQAVS